MSQEGIDSTASESSEVAPGGAAPVEAAGTLLTRNEPQTEEQRGGEQGKGQEDKKPEEGKEQDPEDAVPEKPEGYDLKFDKGVNVDKALLGSFTTKAHELGLSQKQAQALSSIYAKHAVESGQVAQAAQQKAMLEAKIGWEAEITARPGFSGEKLDAQRTLKEFGSPELVELMDTSLLGSHPVFFDFVAKVGKALVEPEARGDGMGGSKEAPLMHRLWPDKKTTK